MRRVWLHGWASSPEIWTLLPRTKDDHKINLSQQNASREFATFADMCWQQLKITEPLNLVAWSFGGLISLAWLARYPQWVRSVTFIASTPYFVGKDQWPGIERQRLDTLNHTLTLSPEEAVKNFWWELAQQESSSKHCFKFLMTTQQGDQRWLLHSLQWLATEDYREVATQYADRCHWILGQHDPIVPISLESKLPGKVSVLNAGHCPMVSCPEELYAIIEGGANASSSPII